MHFPKYEIVSITDIKPYANNPRAHLRKQVRAIAKSMSSNGFNAPIIIDENGVIIAGHGRYEAALLLNFDSVPVIRVTGLSEAQKQAYRIGDNKLGEMSHWDLDRLPVAFEALLEAGIDLQDATAFSTAEIDFVLGHASEARGPDIEPQDRLPHAPGDRPLVSKLGDIWSLGPHRLMCGDARNHASILALMAGEEARMGFIDPPYNIVIEGFASGKGAIQHKNFAMASGELSHIEYVEFLHASLEAAAAVCVGGAILFVCMDWRHIGALLAAADSAGLKYLNLIVWTKTNAGMGSFYRSQHELIAVFKKGDAPHVNNFELGQFGRHRTNVWSYRGANAFGPTRNEDLAAHPTVKPAAMVADAIKDVSHRGDIVIDFVGGSGTTLIAAQMTGRRARVMEIAPTYVDLAVRRWQVATGQAAKHAETGRSFEEEEERRASS